MERTLLAMAAALTLAAAGCADRPPAPAAASALAVSEMHTPWGSGPVAYPTSIYDPSLLDDPSLIEDQPHNRGNKSHSARSMVDPPRSHRG